MVTAECLKDWDGWEIANLAKKYNLPQPKYDEFFEYIGATSCFVCDINQL